MVTIMILYMLHARTVLVIQNEDQSGLDSKRRTCLRQAGRGLLTVNLKFQMIPHTHKTSEPNVEMEMHVTDVK